MHTCRFLGCFTIGWVHSISHWNTCQPLVDPFLSPSRQRSHLSAITRPVWCTTRLFGSTKHWGVWSVDASKCLALEVAGTFGLAVLQGRLILAARQMSFVLYIYMGLSENRVYSQQNSHLVGTMISKTIGFRDTQHFQTNPYIYILYIIYICIYQHVCCKSDGWLWRCHRMCFLLDLIGSYDAPWHGPWPMAFFVHWAFPIPNHGDHLASGGLANRVMTFTDIAKVFCHGPNSMVMASMANCES